MAVGAMGLGSLVSWSKTEASDIIDWHDQPARGTDMRHSMNGRACHDFRMMSDDRSVIIDRKMFDV